MAQPSLAEEMSAASDPSFWIEEIRAAQSTPPRVLAAELYLGQWDTSARPVLLTCADGRDYVVKGSNAGRKTVNDHVVGRLARGMGAPVARVTLVNVPSELVDGEPAMAHITPGLAHGAELLRDVTESYVVEHITEAENRLRYARLAALWGWVTVIDRQYLYNEDPPHLVHSFDHTHSFPSPPDWTRVLLQRAPPPELDRELVGACRFSASEREYARLSLESMIPARIAGAVAAPPPEWGMDMTERVALATFLARRRIQLLRSLATSA